MPLGLKKKYILNSLGDTISQYIDCVRSFIFYGMV